MSDQDLVVATVRDILGGFEPFVLTADRRWDAGLWAALAEAGLTGVGLPEEAGGSGGELADAVAIVRTLAAGAAAVPLAEQLLVAGPALLAAELELPSPEEPLTFAVAEAVTVHPVDNGDGPGRFTVNGTVTDLAWAGAATRVVVLAPAPAGLEGAFLAVIDVSRLEATDAFNLAGDPRGSPPRRPTGCGRGSRWRGRCSCRRPWSRCWRGRCSTRGSGCSSVGRWASSRRSRWSWPRWPAR